MRKEIVAGKSNKQNQFYFSRNIRYSCTDFNNIKIVHKSKQCEEKHKQNERKKNNRKQTFVYKRNEMVTDNKY